MYASVLDLRIPVKYSAAVYVSVLDSDMGLFLCLTLEALAIIVLLHKHRTHPYSTFNKQNQINYLEGSPPS